MNDDLDLLILTRFLGHFEPDVEGRSAGEPPPADLAQKLDRLAHGKVSARERAELADLLKGQPQWIPYLASAIRQGAVQA